MAPLLEAPVASANDLNGSAVGSAVSSGAIATSIRPSQRPKYPFAALLDATLGLKRFAASPM